MSMTLEQAIAESAAEGMQPECWSDSCEKWVDGMIHCAENGHTHARGIIWGAYTLWPNRVHEYLRAYWRQHARPEPEEEWREVEADQLRETAHGVIWRDQCGVIHVAVGPDKKNCEGHFRISIDANNATSLVLEEECIGGETPDG